MNANRIFLTVALLATLSGQTFAQELKVHGNFRHMIQTGGTAGVVGLNTSYPTGTWGVGALAGLRGEVLIADGKVYVSPGSAPGGEAVEAMREEQAVLLAFGVAQEWRSFKLPHDMTIAQLTHFTSRQAAGLGLDLDLGFPIRIVGKFPNVKWHVVTGDASEPSGHGQKLAHGSGTTVAPSGKSAFEESGADGEIIGIFAGKQHEGAASHPDDLLHLHYIDSGRNRSGHVDDIAMEAGSELLLPVKAAATQAMDHSMNSLLAANPPTEGGQSAFAAIGEIVAKLEADANTDWSKVNIEALRQHLIDMDNVTLRAVVAAKPIDGGAEFHVTSIEPAVQASIRRMTSAHAATMNNVNGMTIAAVDVEGGTIVRVTGEAERIQALGFMGIMTTGMHHQTHHGMVATGINPHNP
jgi:alpha-acetolactate decarboxylase